MTDLPANLIEAAEWIKLFFWHIGLGMARLLPIFQIVPFLAGKHMTGLVRNTVAMSLALFLRQWMAAHDAQGIVPAFGAMTALLAKEVLLGTFFAVLTSLAFYVASSVGFIIDNQRGLASATLTDPLSGESTSPLGSLTLETLIMAFVAMGGLSLFFYAVLTTYSFWSPFAYWPDWSRAPLSNLLLSQFSWYLVTMMTLAAPMLIVCFLVDLGMGLMNRFAPQLNVFFLSMPVKSALSMAVLLVYWLAMFRYLMDEVIRLPITWDALQNTLSLDV